MRTLINRLFLMAIIAATASFASCNSSDDNDAPSTPAYAQEAAKFNIATNNAGIVSVELCPNGEYILIRQDNQSLQPELPNGGHNPSITVGKFSVNRDSSVNLIGYGTMTISGKSITFTPAGGEAFTASASMVTLMAATPENMELCRTWNAISYGMELEFNSVSLYNKIAPLSQIDETIRGFFAAYDAVSGNEATTNEVINTFVQNTLDEMPTEILMTRAGTMLFKKNDGSYALKSWRWRNMANNIIEYTSVVVGGGVTSAPTYEPMIVATDGSSLLIHTVGQLNENLVATYTWGFKAK